MCVPTILMFIMLSNVTLATHVIVVLTVEAREKCGQLNGSKTVL